MNLRGLCPRKRIVGSRPSRGETVALIAEITWTYFWTLVALILETHGLRREEYSHGRFCDK